MSESELRQIRVEGLFGLYNHTINLNQEERVTVLRGPNGGGEYYNFKDDSNVEMVQSKKQLTSHFFNGFLPDWQNPWTLLS